MKIHERVIHERGICAHVIQAPVINPSKLKHTGGDSETRQGKPSKSGDERQSGDGWQQDSQFTLHTDGQVMTKRFMTMRVNVDS